jgi:hypothetical protein
MVARQEQDAKRRAKDKIELVGAVTRPHSDSNQEIFERAIEEPVVLAEPTLSVRYWQHSKAAWNEVVESLGRSARVLEELAESTGEAIARITARGDRIDRIQHETRALLNALVAPEADL